MENARCDGTESKFIYVYAYVYTLYIGIYHIIITYRSAEFRICIPIRNQIYITLNVVFGYGSIIESLWRAHGSRNIYHRITRSITP